MELFEARAWLIFDSGVFDKPCAFIRGKRFISQPFFSKTIGRVMVAFVAKNFSLDGDEIQFLHSTLESSDLPEEADRYDMLAMWLGRSTGVFERLTKSAAKEALKKLEDGTIFEMYKPLKAYFDACDDLEDIRPKKSAPPSRTRDGQPIH